MTVLTIQELQAYIDAIVGEDSTVPKLLPIRIAEQLIATMRREAELIAAINEWLQSKHDLDELPQHAYLKPSEINQFSAAVSKEKAAKDQLHNLGTPGTR